MSTDANPREHAYDQVEGFESVLKDMSDEQLEAVRNKATELANADQEINLICEVLINSRRIYALARYALSRQLKQEGHEWSSGVEELMIKAMMDRGLQPFARDDVLDNVKGPLMAFVMDEVQREVESDRFQQMEQARREDDIRGKTPVPIVLRAGDTQLERDQTAVIVGENDHVLAAIDVVIGGLDEQNEREGEQKFSTLVLAPHKLFANITDKDKTVHCVGIDQWAGLCNSRAAMTRLLNGHKKLMFKHRVDALVVYDGVSGFTHGLVEGSPVTATNETLKQLRRWCDEEKAALILGLPLTPDDVEQYSAAAVNRFSKHAEVFCVDKP